MSPPRFGRRNAWRLRRCDEGGIRDGRRMSCSSREEAAGTPLGAAGTRRLIGVGSHDSPWWRQGQERFPAHAVGGPVRGFRGDEGYSGQAPLGGPVSLSSPGSLAEEPRPPRLASDVCIRIENRRGCGFSVNENRWIAWWLPGEIRAILLEQFEAFWRRGTGLERERLGPLGDARSLPPAVYSPLPGPGTPAPPPGPRNPGSRPRFRSPASC